MVRLPDHESPRSLPKFIRFRDLRDAGIADNYTTLARLVTEHAFPPGILISPNIRAWNLDEVERWLATRPSDRKPLPARSEAAARASAAKRKRDAEHKVARGEATA
jgi:predicted DNA-binding transcriptional regulator AlpA